jgi:hypothetical protein
MQANSGTVYAMTEKIEGFIRPTNPHFAPVSRQQADRTVPLPPGQAVAAVQRHG